MNTKISKNSTMENPNKVYPANVTYPPSEDIYNVDKEETEIDLLLAPIRKSKSTYNSTMIALGRGNKQEIKLFLKEKRIGEILTKLKFTLPTLQTFIDEYMPLSAITGKEVYIDVNGQLELSFIQQLEL